MRRDPDLIFLGEHHGEWHVDHEKEVFVAHDNATEAVKAAVHRLNKACAEQKRCGENRF